MHTQEGRHTMQNSAIENTKSYTIDITKEEDDQSSKRSQFNLIDSSEQPAVIADSSYLYIFTNAENSDHLSLSEDPTTDKKIIIESDVTENLNTVKNTEKESERTVKQ